LAVHSYLVLLFSSFFLILWCALHGLF
jgi:hypothetical protein